MASTQERPKTVLNKRPFRAVVFVLEEGLEPFANGIITQLEKKGALVWLLKEKVLKNRKVSVVSKKQILEAIETKKADAFISVGAVPPRGFGQVLKKHFPYLTWAHCGALRLQQKNMPRLVFTFTPEEARILKNRGTEATFIGHPLLMPQSKAFEETQNKNKIAVLPPASAGRMRRIMPILIKILAFLRIENPKLEVIIPLDGKTKPRYFEPYHTIEATYLRGQGILAELQACQVAICCSKQWAFPLALLGVPFIELPTSVPFFKFLRKEEKTTSILAQEVLLRTLEVGAVPLEEGAILKMVEALMVENSAVRKKQLAAFSKIQTALQPAEKNKPFVAIAEAIMARS